MVPFKQCQVTLDTKTPILYAVKVVCLLITALDFMQIPPGARHFVTFPAAPHQDSEQMLQLQKNEGKILAPCWDCQCSPCETEGQTTERRNLERRRPGGGMVPTGKYVCKSEDWASFPAALVHCQILGSEKSLWPVTFAPSQPNTHTWWTSSSLTFKSDACWKMCVCKYHLLFLKFNFRQTCFPKKKKKNRILCASKQTKGSKMQT